MAGLHLPDYGSIRALLSRTRGRALAVSVGTGLALGLAGALVLALAASLLLGSLSAERAVSLRWVGLVAAAAALVVLGLSAWRWILLPLRSLADAGPVAQHLERALPQLAGLASAVELEREAASGDPSWSRPLAEAHVSRLAQAAAAVDPRPAVPTRGLSRAAAVLGLAASIHLLSLLAFGETVGRGYARLLGRERTVAELLGSGASGMPALITGDVELVYHYPGYTRLAPRTVAGTGGDISALKGTEVEIRTTADRNVEGASLVVGNTALPLKVTGLRGLEGRLVVNEPGSYRFRFEDASGDPVAEGALHKITLEADAYPEVEASLPGRPGDEVEVREQDALMLEWRAQDDYGLTEIALVWRVGGGKPQRQVLGHPEEQERGEGRHRWDLTTLHLAPGDRVAWFVEGVDNDAVSGPKKGVSPTRYLKVFSAAEHHRDLMEKVEAKWEAMILSLADHLEKPFDTKDGEGLSEVAPRLAIADGHVNNLDKLVDGLNDLIGQLAADPLAPPALVDALANIRGGILRTKSTARNALRGFQTRLVQREIAGGSLAVRRAQTEVVEELEKDILYLEDLLDKQRIQDLIAMGEEIKAHKRRLAELIDKLKTDPDEETRVAVGQEIARIKERIHELMQKMSEMVRSINDEHLNAEAMRELSESQDLLGGLDDVQKLLNEGKLDEALSRLSEMTDNLEQMLENWREQDENFGNEEYAEVARELSEVMDDLQRLRRDQEKLLDESGKLKDTYQKALEERMKGRLDELVQKLKEKAEGAQEQLGKVPEEALGSGFAHFDRETQQNAAERLRDLGMLLEARDFAEAHEIARQALQQTSNLSLSMREQASEARRLRGLMGRRGESLKEAAERAERARDLSQDIVDELDKLFPDPREVFGREDQRRMAQMGEQQEDVRRRANSLQQKMDEVGKKAPVFSPGMEGELRQAGRHMAEASYRLGQSDARSASGQQKAALDRLGKLQEQMQQMAQGSGRGGLPMPMSSGGQGGGGRGMSRERVEIPDADQYKAPEAFRKELLEAMKQGTPERYEQQVKRYYEELVK